MKRILFLCFCILPVLCFAQPGYIHTYAGGGSSSADSIPATSAYMNSISSVCTDSHGDLFISVVNDCKVRKVNARTGIITNYAGTGYHTYTGDGGPATAASFDRSAYIAIDGSDNLYIADYNNQVVRKVDASTRIITTVAGGGSSTSDSVPATTESLAFYDIAVDAPGNLYVYTSNNRVKKVNVTTGLIYTIGGGGSSWADSIPATNAPISQPQSMRADAAGNVYYVESYTHGIRKIDATTGIVTTLTGTGSSVADSIPAASYYSAGGEYFDFDPSGNIILLDAALTIRKLDIATGIIKIIGGGGSSVADSVPATATNMTSYDFLHVDRVNNIYISSYLYSKVRKINDYPLGFFSGFGSDSLDISVNKLCSGPQLTTLVNHYAASSTIKTYFGDGTSITNAVSFGYGGVGFVVLNHTYDNSGTYAIKQVLSIAGTAVDSFQFSYTHIFCSTIPVQVYYDNDNNCNKDLSEPLISQPILTEVDSNGIAIDTISSTSGFYYRAFGYSGDVYSFRILSVPTGFHVACPSTGIISDTLVTSVYTKPVHYMGIACDSAHAVDLGVFFGSVHTGVHTQDGNIYAFNNYCTPTNGTVILSHSSRYSYFTATPAPSSTTATSITWNISALTGQADSLAHIYYWLEAYSGYLLPGDTTNSIVTIIPTTGDADTTNNIAVRVDTVRAGYDPNSMEVTPAYHTTSGTKLQYTIHFENTGNDTAHNIYVMDTLSDDVDISSYNIVAASHTMFLTKLKSGGHNILKFDFPVINLLDSSHHCLCDGMVTYTIKSKAGLPDCHHIYNRAGIYFDVNPVVMTNTADNVIGCWPSSVGNLQFKVSSPHVYPNPAYDVLNVETEGTAIASYTITNSVGSVVLTNAINTKLAQVNIKALPSGLYFINLKGMEGTVVRRFVKW